MNPIFRFLDSMLREHGGFLSALFVYVAIPFAAWTLGRRSGRRKVKQGHTFVLVIPAPPQSSGVPPVIRWNFEPPPDDASSPFDGL
jgi:hypothetical protein